MRVLFISLAMVAIAGCDAQGGEAGGKGGPRQPPLVIVAAVQTVRFVDRIDAVGTAIANEQVTLAAPVTERITRLNFDDGGYVQRGQIVAVLAAGQENAALAEAGAREREASQQLDRIEALKSRGFATNSAVDSQTALAGQARAQAAAARASIGDRVIRAPFSGWVSLRNISTGAIVTAGTEIATISDISRIKLDFAVPETLLGSIAPGMTIEGRAAAFPDQPFRGTIASIDPVLNAETRAVTVRALLANGDRKLKPGMLLTVIVEAAARAAMAVPELAVVGDGNQTFVYLIEQGKAKRVEVVTGSRQGGNVEIVEGLEPGARVVTEGVVKLSDGQRVRLAGAENARPKGKGAPKGENPPKGEAKGS